MDNISSFYNSLFAIEFAVLSLLLAGVFLFFQIVYQDRLFKLTRGIPRRKIYFVAIVCLVSLLITATGAMLSAFPRHDFIPAYNLNSHNYITNPWFGLLAVLLFFVSAIMAMVMVIKEILSLKPSGLLERASKNIKAEDIRNYLIKQYGLHEPFFIKLNFTDPAGKSVEIQSSDEEEKQYHEDLALHKKLIVGADSESDPLEPLGELAIRSIRNRDMSLLEKALKALNGVLEKDIYVKNDPKSKWNVNSHLFTNQADYILKWVSFLIEECKKEGTSRLSSSIYNFTNEIALMAVRKEELQGARKVISFWKLEADKALATDTRITTQLIKLHSGLGKELFSDESESAKSDILNEVFRSLGWLAERLLEKSGIETKPLMYDLDYETSYDAILEAILTFESDYSKNPKAYPRIYFDAVSVMFLGLITEAKRNKDQPARRKIYENIFDCAFIYSNFALVAIKAGNGNGASLATMRLIEAFKELRENAKEDILEKSARDTIGLMIGVAFTAAGLPLENTSSDFMEDGIESRLLDVLSQIPHDYDSVFDKEIMDHYIRADRPRNYDAVKSFIKKLGAARGSNFGLNLK
jgi:hypothetical protein